MERTTADIEVRLIEDGGNPRCDNDIEAESGGFRIKPYCEDSDGMYKFRLDLELINRTENSIPTQFVFEWNDIVHIQNRRYVLVYSGQDTWVKYPGSVSGSTVRVVVDVPPGHSRLCMHPPYDFGRLVNILGQLPESRFRVNTIGKSMAGRDIYAVEFGRAELRPVVVITRVHPYETIGSYFSDGMLEWMKNYDDEAQKVLARNRVIIIPMPNPDGVAEGLCKRTLGGLDYSYAAASDEPEAVSVKNYLKSVNAQAIFDLHGHMNDHDRFRTNDAERMKAFRKRLLSFPLLFNKELFSYNEQYPPNGKEINIGGFVVTELKGVFFNSSWTWFDRDADHLRAMGVSILRAYTDLFR